MIHKRSALALLGIVLATGLSLHLGQQLPFSIDFSGNAQFSLSDQTLNILTAVDAPLDVYAIQQPNNSHRRKLDQLIDLYRVHHDIQLHIIDPDRDIDWIREHGVLRSDELVLQLSDRVEHAIGLTETAVSAAILRLVRASDQFVAVLSGHGERSLHRPGNHDLKDFAAFAASMGVQLRELNLAEVHQIPTNARVLLIADPQTDYLTEELATIRDFIADGGNLLWLMEPQRSTNLEPLSDELNVRCLPGVVVDTKTQLLGLQDPRFALITDYLSHPVTSGLTDQTTLLPHACALDTGDPQSAWVPLLSTDERSWTETAPMQGEIFYSPADDERAGPLVLGVALERPADDSGIERTLQRIIVLGDGDFISNAYLANGANKRLGVNLINWLLATETLMDLRPPEAADTQLTMSMPYQVALFLVFLGAVPMLPLGYGLLLWYQRRH